MTNDTDERRTAAFTLRGTAGAKQTVRAFELADVQPGETRTWGPETLAAGAYELEITVPPTLSTRTEWTGRDCPAKRIGVEIRSQGLRLRNDCSDA